MLLLQVAKLFTKNWFYSLWDYAALQEIKHNQKKSFIILF